MNGTISVLSFSDRMSSAALVGSFAGDNAAFLARHLEELAGDVLLECEHLDDLDAAGASVLHAFRETRDRQGFWVFFRGIQPRCREQLLDQAREGSGSAVSSSA